MEDHTVSSLVYSRFAPVLIRTLAKENKKVVLVACKKLDDAQVRAIIRFY